MKTRLLVILITMAACPPPSESGTDGTPPASTLSTGGATTTTTGTTEAPTTSGTADASTTPSATTTTTTGEPCPVGALGCECTPGGFCDPPLVCEAGTCVEGCAVGSLGCACTGGDGCDAGLTCDSGICGPGLSPPCDPDILDDDCCGDGIVDEFEDCDMYGLNDDSGPCTLSCKQAVCGDGLVYAGVEACDGDEFCTAECMFSSCGNGAVEPYEWCEPRGHDDPECTAMCTDARKVVFITSANYQGGALGGLSGANEKCQEHAAGAGFAGEFWALLGDSEATVPLFSWPLTGVSYFDVNGVFLADSIEAFCHVPNEFGQQHQGCDVEYAGTYFWTWWMLDWSDAITCGGWKDPMDPSGGSAITVGCSHSAKGAPCSAEAPIICVEQ